MNERSLSDGFVRFADFQGSLNVINLTLHVLSFASLFHGDKDPGVQNFDFISTNTDDWEPISVPVDLSVNGSRWFRFSKYLFFVCLPNPGNQQSSNGEHLDSLLQRALNDAIEDRLCIVFTGIGIDGVLAQRMKQKVNAEHREIPTRCITFNSSPVECSESDTMNAPLLH